MSLLLLLIEFGWRHNEQSSEDRKKEENEHLTEINSSPRVPISRFNEERKFPRMFQLTNVRNCENENNFLTFTLLREKQNIDLAEGTRKRLFSTNFQSRIQSYVKFSQQVNCEFCQRTFVFRSACPRKKVKSATMAKFTPPAKSVSLSSWKVAAMRKNINWMTTMTMAVMAKWSSSRMFKFAMIFLYKECYDCRTTVACDVVVWWVIRYNLFCNYSWWWWRCSLLLNFNPDFVCCTWWWLWWMIFRGFRFLWDHLVTTFMDLI